MQSRCPTFSRLLMTLAAIFSCDSPADAQEATERSLNTGRQGTSEYARGVAMAAGVTPQGEHRAADDAIVIAQQTSAETTDMSASIVVRGFEVAPVEYPALPDVEGTRINSGKKTSFVKPEEFPAIANNNYREALATTPGLLVSEEPSSPIINIGYRGLDSQRSESTQMLKDGVSIKNEQFGFPESHYAPILDAIERIEFIRAGASLQFGPQPGGAINFVTRMPQRDVPFEFLTKNLFGSDELYQNFTSANGTAGPLGYYAYYDHREREGFRTNSDYEVNAGSVKLVYDVSADSHLVLILDGYDEEHGEPGGLTEVPVFGEDGSLVPGLALYSRDRNVTTRFFDRFRLERYYATLEYQKIVSEDTQIDIKAFGGYLSRFSKRQRGGDFGIAPDPNPEPDSDASTNDIQLREDWTQGAELRLRHDYNLFGDTSTLAGGLYFYHAVQDRSDKRGETPDAEEGVLRRFNTGETYDGSIFAENRFHFGRLSITPGVRLEFFQQSLSESVNTTKPGEDLLERSDFSFVPLFSLGASYVLLEAQEIVSGSPAAGDSKGVKDVAPRVTTGGPPRVEVYGTVAQAYRPRTYGELVPTGPGSIVNGDLEEGHSLQFELGTRGKPLPYLTFDVGAFYFDFEDQVGDITITNANGTFSSTGNVGDARYSGFEAAAELDVLGMINGGAESRYGRFNLYGNITLLDTEFTSGPNKGFDTTYAPDYQFKIGGIYRWKEVAKVGLLGTFVDDSYADVNNTPSHFIPAYAVWDLTAEIKFWDGQLGLIAGINNLFDEDYYGEIRDEGIVPAYRRNYYGGVTVRF